PPRPTLGAVSLDTHCLLPQSSHFPFLTSASVRLPPGHEIKQRPRDHALRVQSDCARIQGFGCGYRGVAARRWRWGAVPRRRPLHPFQTCLMGPEHRALFVLAQPLAAWSVVGTRPTYEKSFARFHRNSQRVTTPEGALHPSIYWRIVKNMDRSRWRQSV